MNESGDNGLTQSVEPAVDANYVFVFVGDTRRTGDKVCERVNRVENQPESSMKDDQVNGVKAMARMDASRSSQRQLKSMKIVKLIQGVRLV